MTAEQNPSIKVEDIQKVQGRFRRSIDRLQSFAANIQAEAEALRSPIVGGPRSLRQIVEAERRLEKINQRVGKVPAATARLQGWITTLDEAKESVEDSPYLDEALEMTQKNADKRPEVVEEVNKRVEINEGRINAVVPLVNNFIAHTETQKAVDRFEPTLPEGKKVVGDKLKPLLEILNGSDPTATVSYEEIRRHLKETDDKQGSERIKKNLQEARNFLRRHGKDVDFYQTFMEKQAGVRGQYYIKDADSTDVQDRNEKTPGLVSIRTIKQRGKSPESAKIPVKTQKVLDALEGSDPLATLPAEELGEYVGSTGQVLLNQVSLARKVLRLREDSKTIGSYTDFRDKSKQYITQYFMEDLSTKPQEGQVPPAEDTEFLIKDGRRRTELKVAYVVSHLGVKLPKDIQALIPNYREDFRRVLFVGMDKNKRLEYEAAMKETILKAASQDEEAIALLEEVTTEEGRKLVGWLNDQMQLKAVELSATTPMVFEFDDKMPREEIDRILEELGAVVVGVEPNDEAPITVVIERGEESIIPAAQEKPKRNGKGLINSPESLAKIREIITNMPAADKEGFIEETKLGIRQDPTRIAVEKGVAPGDVRTKGHHYKFRVGKEAARVKYYIEYAGPKNMGTKALDNFDEVYKRVLAEIETEKTNQNANSNTVANK